MAPFLITDEIGKANGFMNEFHMTLHQMVAQFSELIYVVAPDGTAVLTEVGHGMKNFVITAMKELAFLLKEGMILGPFFMFRKSLIEKSGVFDEQLIQGPDYDLALRLVRNGKAYFMPDNLGYYLNEGLGMSTKPDSKQPLERTAIELRYNVRVLDNSLVQLAKDTYDLDNIIIDEEKIPVTNFV